MTGKKLSLAEIRREYMRQELSETMVDRDPFRQFSIWFEEVMDSEVTEPTAMTLATASRDGRPSARTVLLKEVNSSGFVFFTNYHSRKARDIEENPTVALLFFWPELERQVRIDGYATKISREESEKYFQSRPRGSQIGAWASPQSDIIESREVIENRVKEIERQFAGHDVLPLPDFWGGYVVNPQVIEFWQGRPNRLHDRIVYEKNLDHWQIYRLAP